MSARIHEIAKKYNIEPKEMLAWLKQQGFVSADTKSVSSTVSTIFYDEIEKEYGAKPAPAAEPEPAAPAPGVEPAPSKIHLPAGVFVKSLEDLAREREEAGRALAAVQAAAKAAAETAAQAARPPLVPPPPTPTPAPFAAKSPLPVPPLPGPKSPPPPPLAPRPSFASARPPAFPPAAPAPTPPPLPVAAPPRSPAPAQAAKAPMMAPPMPTAAARVSLPPAPGKTPPPASSAPSSVTLSEEAGVKTIHAKPPIIVRDFAVALGLKPFKLISELMEMNVFASMNQAVDEAIAAKLAEKHGFLIDIKHRGEPQPAAVIAASKEDEAKVRDEKAREEDTRNLAPRPPVVCILGHVDHGKTSLLDAIRKAHVAEGEAGGITQHIGAYQVRHHDRLITFLDTPGHAAFSKMRARGANVTDLAVLVVAADDGFMPQTDEALQHALAAKVTLMVAVNKMDVKGANLDRVKTQMQERNLAPEDWGGDTVTVPVSALKGQGITELLDMILLQADVLELKANPKAPASGVVIESEIELGRGALATVIVERGTLRVGDSLVCGAHWCKVRAMFDDQGANVKEAPPATPVRVIGWSGAPDSGAKFNAVKHAREAEKIAEEEEHRLKKLAVTAAATPKDTSLDALFANIAATQEKVLRIVIKSDVFGSVEAVRQVLEGIKSTKVSLDVVAADVGVIGKNDVLMASAAKAAILGFHTKQENGVPALAKHHGVAIEHFSIIYELADRVREMMADLLDPDLKEIRVGAAEVRQVFPISHGFVAGCLVTEGKINRGAAARVRRAKDAVAEGKVSTLRRFKDDANEVRAGLECGIRIENFDGYQPGDKIECFEILKVRASL